MQVQFGSSGSLRYHNNHINHNTHNTYNYDDHRRHIAIDTRFYSKSLSDFYCYFAAQFSWKKYTIMIITTPKCPLYWKPSLKLETCCNFYVKNILPLLANLGFLDFFYFRQFVKGGLGKTFKYISLAYFRSDRKTNLTGVKLAKF